ncbi:hypothetical protein K501DRAFT_291374 [Backusella circina FSU 941]|nr:hypothetical protein K501DRAFT_291374 [Backusella circina FSU 941]
MEEKNILIWSGSIWDSEANKVGYKLKASAYPFMALITLQAPYEYATPKMTVVERMEGFSNPEEWISQLSIAIERNGSVIHRLNNERERRDVERRLKEEQDMAYLKSLEADKEKARKLEQEEKAIALEKEKLLQKERQVQIQQEKRAQYIQYLYDHLPKEPTKGECVTLCFKLADGDKIVRRFGQDDSLKTIYDFVQVYPLIKQNNPKSTEPIAAPPDHYQHTYSFNIHSCFPKVEYEPTDLNKLCNIKNLWPSATLIVDAAENESDSDI